MLVDLKARPHKVSTR